MAWTLLPAIISAAAAAKGAVDARKAQKEQLALQQQAMQQGASGGTGNPQTGQVDITALDALTRDMARKNAIQSMELEKELNPEVASLRTNAINSLQGDLAPDAYDQALRAGLMNDFQNQSLINPQGRSQLSQDVYNRAGADLALGGAIPQDVQNAMTRRALGQAGRVGGGLELGRDIVARDLGLTSLDLMNNRLAAAQGVGAQEDAYRMNTDQFMAQQQQQALNQRLNSAGLVANMGNADASRRTAIAALMSGIDQPISGLDPAAAAMLSVGNVNALQAYLANQRELAVQNKAASNAATGQLISALPGAISAIGGAFNRTPTSSYGTTPSFNTTLGSIPTNQTPTFSAPSYYAPSSTFSGSSLPAFNYSSMPTTTTGLYGNVVQPQFTSPTSFPTGTGCWVARSAYGEDNPKWREWREWLFTRGPKWLRRLYLKHGERFAAWLDNHAWFKPAVRATMNTILKGAARA